MRWCASALQQDEVLMQGYLLVDGYNVLNSWRLFEKLRQQSLDHAREVLIAYISEYAAFKGYAATIVFDAQKNPEPGTVIETQGLVVVYTDEGETADSWIERRTYELKGRKVFVVTSDYAEQLNVLGAGAYRISAREFYEDYKKAKEEIAEELQQPKRALNRNELGGRIDSNVLAYLEQLRRQG